MLAELLQCNPNDVVSFSQTEVTDRIHNLSENEICEITDREEYRPSLERVQELGRQLNELLEGKEEVVRLLLACTISQVPMILLGPPGTAKSLVVRQFCALLGLRPHHENIESFAEQVKGLLSQESARPGALGVGRRGLFEYLLTRFTTPEEIIGPVNIAALLRLSLFYRDPEGMLPSAEIAFLDEIFKANSAILNSLLAIINERIYYNAGRVFDVRLVNVFGASNEPPDAEELAALYDRFPIRVVSRPVDDSQVEELIQRALRYEYSQAINHRPRADGDHRFAESSTGPVACVNDFRLLFKVIHVMYGGVEQFRGGFHHTRSGFVEGFIALFRQLRWEFNISDRTPERLIRVARALALLAGRRTLTPEELCVFKYCSPDIDSAEVLSDIVDEYIAAAA